jgi:hypothetical protein
MDGETEKQTTSEAWNEVGRQFQTLGESLAEAFRTTWESEETRQHVQNMQAGLEQVADQVDRTIKETSASEEMQKLRGEAEKAAESFRAAGERTWRDTRPHLLSALSQLNAELQKMIARLEQEEAFAEAPAAEDVPDE